MRINLTRTYILLLLAAIAGCSGNTPQHEYGNISNSSEIKIELVKSLTSSQFRSAGLFAQCMLPIVEETDAIYFPSLEQQGNAYATVYKDIRHESGLGNYVLTYISDCKSEWTAYVEEITSTMSKSEAESFKASNMKRKQLAIYALIRERRAKIVAQAQSK